MKKYLAYVLPTLLALNILATAYMGWELTKKDAQLTQLANLHDAVLLQIVCTTRVTGIIDLAVCPAK